MSKKRNSSDSLLLALSHTVKERRELLRLSQEEVAHRAKLHRTYISDIERGARNLSLKSLVDLARALDLSASQLIISAEGRLSELVANGQLPAEPVITIQESCCDNGNGNGTGSHELAAAIPDFSGSLN